MIIVADTQGRILFFDNRVKLLYWLTEFNLGSIRSISFSLAEEETYSIDSFKVFDGCLSRNIRLIENLKGIQFFQNQLQIPRLEKVSYWAMKIEAKKRKR